MRNSSRRTNLCAWPPQLKTVAACAVTVAVGKVERLFAWLHNFRRIVIRWEYTQRIVRPGRLSSLAAVTPPLRHPAPL